ncbi:hypothetical protein TKK_0007169 [Trichogramma kaykai]|uniref:Ubiquitin-like protease family profile domain-containing protein n=1 Tax=Trichogramma kaykai TaxID=54128 RepID=A0ABD2X9Z4_9HYME
MTFLEATNAGDFQHWLTMEDISAVLMFVYDKPAGSFEIVSMVNFKLIVSQYFQRGNFLMPMILNPNEVHWVLVWLGRHGDFSFALYHDSLGKSMW